MESTLIKQFWDDYIIPTQELDKAVSFVNPSDLVRSLVKARNWSGVLTEHLINLRKLQNTTEKKISQNNHDLTRLEKQILSRTKLTSIVTKNKDIQKTHIFSTATEDERTTILGLELNTEVLHQDLVATISEIKDLERMLRLLVDSTDWLVQYLNWYKFETRTLDNA